MQKGIRQIVQHNQVVVICVYVFVHVDIKLYMYTNGCIHNFTVNQVVLENQYTIDSWELMLIKRGHVYEDPKSTKKRDS